MFGSRLKSRDILRIDRLIYVPVILMLISIWAVVIDFKIDERAELLQVAGDELYSSTDTIGDAETAVIENPAWSEEKKRASRDDTIQDQTRLHPGAHFWLEANGVVFAGSAFPLDSPSVLYVLIKRDAFTVHAALPETQALADWRASLVHWAGGLAALTIVVLTMAAFLARILRRNAIAEVGLRKRDAVLRTINDAATALASTEDYETVIADVLASVGGVMGVDRVTLRDLAPFGAESNAGKRLFEWHQPDLPSLAGIPSVVNAEFGEYYTPLQFAQAMRGEPHYYYIDDRPNDGKAAVVKLGMLSSVIFAVIVNGQPYCSLSFADAHNRRREWTETENDTLRTLSGIMAAAMTRTHQARERSKAEAKLGNRDAILQAVTESAANLLSTQDLDATITETLAALGQALGISRVYIASFTLTDDRRVLTNLTYEWFKPGMIPAKTHRDFVNTDVTSVYPPEKLNEAFSGKEEIFFPDRFHESAKSAMIGELGMRSFACIAVMVDGKFHGNLAFCDDSPERESWTPTEIATLKTLTQLVGAALTRAHQARERSKIEAKLGNRDAILQAVTDGAAKLLNTENPDTTIAETLAALGPALGLSRIYIATFTVTDDRILVTLTHDWFRPGLVTAKGHPAFTNSDVTSLYPPERFAKASAGQEEAYHADDLPAPDKAASIEIGALASVAVPVMVDGEFRGNLVFADDLPGRRSWTPTEIATLKTLTQLVGAALARAHYLEQRQKAMTNLVMRERALEGISQGITISDFNAPDYRIIYANPAFAALMRYPLEELIGRVSSSLLSVETSYDEKRVERSIRGNKTGRTEIQVKRKDGSTFLDAITSTVIPDQNGQPIYMVAIHEDVTELRKREDLLLEARKLESVGHLTGGIAHDFNNLLMAIRANAEDLRDELKHDELLQSQAEIVLEAADRGAGLVAQLMAFARKQELAPQTVAVNALISAFTKQLQRTLPANIEVDTRLTDGLPTVNIDPGRLESAIQSLVLNARDAMPDGGTITIETAFKTLDDDNSAGNEGIPPGSYVLLAVTDSGTGMPPEIVDKAFTPFFTTKEVGKGSGLGLSMVYGFIKQSGGYARIYSEVGMGTVVKIYLQATALPARVARDADTTPGRAAGVGAILAVEDDDVVRDAVSARLTHLGYRVVTAANAQEAIDILENTPHFDLVFSDVVMPGAMNGADLIREVRRRWPGTSVLLTSGYTATTVFEKITLPPDVGILSKPYSNSELASVVREALARSADKVA